MNKFLYLCRKYSNVNLIILNLYTYGKDYWID